METGERSRPEVGTEVPGSGGGGGGVSGEPEVRVGGAGLLGPSGRNGKTVVCARCGSTVLRPGAALYSRRELFLPSMRQSTALGPGNSSVEGDVLQEHWLVDDMYTFENVGFTKNVNSIKYLTCADCEIGPIGWHSLDDSKSFYIALKRVKHE
uniref:Guanine nucleotide exchange factor MSS4 n=1 Tax=Callorhinchus milii TaxID=7868 RepID=V9KYC9_CALMI